MLLQDIYNIGALTVNIEFMWLGTKWMERLAKARLSPVSKPLHINYILIVNTPILYMHCNINTSLDFYNMMNLNLNLRKLNVIRDTCNKNVDVIRDTCN
jgi:hypothetical protein